MSKAMQKIKSISTHLRSLSKKSFKEFDKLFDQELESIFKDHPWIKKISFLVEESGGQDDSVCFNDIEADGADSRKFSITITQEELNKAYRRISDLVMSNDNFMIQKFGSDEETRLITAYPNGKIENLAY